MMLGMDCKLIYGTKDYHRKRLKVLEEEGYIKRVKRVYIKLDNKGTRIVKEFGYDYNFPCRKKEYIERVNEVAIIAGLTINTDIDFIASWNVKDDDGYTDTSRKYIGKLIYKGKESIVYYISKDKKTVYIRQLLNDIQKIYEEKNIIVFLEDMNMLNEKQKFVFNKESTYVIRPAYDNLSIIRKLLNADYYQIVKDIYDNKEILLSNWMKADYMTEDKIYIIIMPFIDTERVYKLNLFLKNNQNKSRKIDIITLKENKEKLNEILTNKVNIIEIDKWLGGININEQGKEN